MRHHQWASLAMLDNTLLCTSKVYNRSHSEEHNPTFLLTTKQHIVDRGYSTGKSVNQRTPQTKCVPHKRIHTSAHEQIRLGWPRIPMNSVYVNSSISGSSPVVGYPKLFADFHALHRLSMPRHPPCALSNLTIGISISNQTNSIKTNPLQGQPQCNCTRLAIDLQFAL
jgi:hypothetical protein